MSSSRSDVVTLFVRLFISLSVRPYVTLSYFSQKWTYGALKPYITFDKYRTFVVQRTKERTYLSQLSMSHEGLVFFEYTACRPYQKSQVIPAFIWALTESSDMFSSTFDIFQTFSRLFNNFFRKQQKSQEEGNLVYWDFDSYTFILHNKGPLI